MANPVVTVTLDKPSYTPGSPIVVSWSAVDADNSTETIRWEGADGEGNAVSGEITIARQDSFTMTRVYWPRTGVSLAVDNSTRKATGTVPSA